MVKWQQFMGQQGLGQYSMESNYQCSILLIIFQEMASYLAQGRQTNSSQDEQYYFLQPMFEKLPPNQIISEKYAPDVVPHVKLMTNKDERRNNIHYIPPKTKNVELQNYADLFDAFDFLGKQYADKINQIVYLKFNNAKYNLSPELKLKTRIMPAFYLPFQQIYNTNQAYVTKNIGLQFPQACLNCMLPTAKYNRGCSMDPIFCSNYQSANLFAVFRKNPFEYDLILQNDINSCKSINWFNFSVQFSQQGYYSFKIVNLTEDMSKIYERGMKISYCYLNPLANKPYKRNGEGWGFCGENIKFSKSTIERQQKKGQNYYQLYFQFKCKNKHDIIVFALDVPYNTLDAQTFFNNILFKKIKNMLKIEKKQFGKTISGSPLVSYQISRKKLRGQSIQITPPQVAQTHIQGKNKRVSINLLPLNRSINNIVQTHNKSIIILGRAEGGDTSGSFIMEGMIDYLLDTIEFQSMKRVFDFYFIPLVNIDAVKYGSTVANLTGSILNKGWANPHKYYQSEIFCLKQFLKEINKESPISLIINLATQKQDLYSSVVGVKNDTDETQDSRIFPFILAKRNKLFSFQKSTFFKKDQNNSMCCVLNELFSKALIYQLNVSHFQSIKKYQDSPIGFQPDTQLKQCTPQIYRNFGKDLLSYYLEHVKLYDKNLLLKDKWVKQIEEIQNQVRKKSVKYVDQLIVQDKFPQAFYQIQNISHFTTSGIKIAKKVVSNKFLNTPKTFEMDRLQKSIKKQKLFRNIPHSVKDFVNKINQTDAYLKSKYQTNTDLKKAQCQNTDIQKPISLFRIGQKKSSILLNCPSNTLNFELEGQNKFKNKISKDKNIIEKQILRKELSTKLLKKVKIEDTLKGWKSKDKLHDVKLGQFLNNS